MEIYLEQLPQQLVNGLTLGGVYALIAIGYTMVYGILGMLNFAHGEVYMIGGFTGWWVLHLLTRGNELLVNAVMVIALMIIMAMAVSGLFLLGYGLFRFSIEFVRVPDAHIGYLAFDWFTMGQLLTLPMLIGGAVLFWLAHNREKRAD